MSAPSKRGRACEACSRLKIKCELGSSLDSLPPCQRCIRLEKNCVLVPRVKQKDRVAELESQVAALTSLLKAQGIQDPNTADADENQEAKAPSEKAWSSKRGAGSAKKRRLSPSSSETPSSLTTSSETPSSLTTTSEHVRSPLSPSQGPKMFKLDDFVSHDLQQHVLDKYINQIFPYFPLVPLSGGCSLESLRSERPLLLLAVIYAASPGSLTLEVQEELTKGLLSTLVEQAITQGNKSFELLQAIQITSMWFRSPRTHIHVTAIQLIQMASHVAIELGLAGLTPWTLMFTPNPRVEDVESAEASGSWLVCHVLSTCMAILMRSSDSSKWSAYHDICLYYLEYPPDKQQHCWAGQYLRGEHLCEDIAFRMGLCDLYAILDVTHSETRAKIEESRAQILSWKMVIPSMNTGEAISLLEHVATAYLHELVLHTSTNKESFAAPYVAERLSLGDFPCPYVTEHHITSLLALRNAVQAILGIYATLDTAALTAYPGLVFSSRAAYALYILSKLYIATTATGNTYGTALPPETLQMAEYIAMMVRTADRLDAFERRSGACRIMSSAYKVQEWFTTYTRSIAKLGAASQTADLAQDFQRIDAPCASPSFDWETLFGNSDYGYGLADLFTEPVDQRVAP